MTAAMPVTIILSLVAICIGYFFWALWRVGTLRGERCYVHPGSGAWRTIGLRSRSSVDLNRVPPHVLLAVIFFEDYRFFVHGGISFQAMFYRLRLFLRGAPLAGGSTISQQVVKVVFVGAERTIRRKLAEIVHAIALECRFSKAEILSLYLSSVRIGASMYGLENGARLYFGSSIERLHFQEALVFACMLPAPGLRHNAVFVQRQWSRFAINDFFARCTTLNARLRTIGLSLTTAECIRLDQIPRALTAVPTLDRATAQDIEEETTIFCQQVVQRLQHPNRAWEARPALINTLGPCEQFLVACIQSSFGVDRPYLMQPLPDPHEFVALVQRLALVPVVRTVLDPAIPEHEKIRELLRPNALMMAQATLRQQHELRVLVDAFARAGCEVRLVKGLAVAARYYDTLTARQPGDIDLLVRRSDALAAARVLQSLGYVPRIRGVMGSLAARGSATFLNDQGMVVDLHCELLEPRYGVDLSGVWTAHEVIRVGDVSIPALTRADDFLFLVLHGSKHMWGRFSWIVDCARCALTLTDDDWRSIAGTMQRLGVATHVGAATVMMSHIAGIPMPPPFFPAPSSKANVLAWRMTRNVILAPYLRSRIENTRVACALLEGAGRKAGYLLARLFGCDDAEADNGALMASKLFRLFEKRGVAS